MTPEQIALINSVATKIPGTPQYEVAQSSDADNLSEEASEFLDALLRGRRPQNDSPGSQPAPQPPSTGRP